MHFRSTEHAKTLHNVSDSYEGPIQTFGGLVPKTSKILKPMATLLPRPNVVALAPADERQGTCQANKPNHLTCLVSYGEEATSHSRKQTISDYQ
jgi:hypothetical protein